MFKPDVSSILDSIQDVTAKHSTEILTGLGVAGVVLSIGFAIRATVKATKAVDDYKTQKEKELSDASGRETIVSLSKTDVVKLSWKYYIPTAITGACSIACIIGSHSILGKEKAAIAAAYALTEGAYQEYKDKVADTIGEKKEAKLCEAIVQDKIDANPPSSNEIVITSKGDSLCFDVFSGRYFRSDMDTIKRTVNQLNELLLFDTYLCLNEFYVELGLEEIGIGNSYGWDVDPNLSTKGLIDVVYGSHLTPEGDPCITITLPNVHLLRR